ncbi:hypothetical protein [Azospirillum sp.]|uniref:hypothetical protein n=1 Tax=Azospirillum sp. TaxID=34012 RepID=UPI003D722622
MDETEPGALSPEGRQIVEAMEAITGRMGAQIAALTALCAVLARELAASGAGLERVEGAVADTLKLLPAGGRQDAAAVIETVLAALRAHEPRTAH